LGGMTSHFLPISKLSSSLARDLDEQTIPIKFEWGLSALLDCIHDVIHRVHRNKGRALACSILVEENLGALHIIVHLLEHLEKLVFASLLTQIADIDFG